MGNYGNSCGFLPIILAQNYAKIAKIQAKQGKNETFFHSHHHA